MTINFKLKMLCFFNYKSSNQIYHCEYGWDEADEAQTEEQQAIPFNEHPHWVFNCLRVKRT